MENETLSEFGAQSTENETKADKEWSEFERDLDRLGRQLAELHTHTAALGTHFVSSVEARFEEVRKRAESFGKERAVEIELIRLRPAREAESAFADVRQRSTEAARQAWERSEPLRKGAKDVGEGLARAWGEIWASFGKAAGRLHTETRANGPTPVTTQDRHERT